MKKEFAVSLAIHTALVALLLVSATGKEPNPTPGESDKGPEGKNQGQEIAVELIPLTGGDAPAPCDQWYEGVGLIQAYNSENPNLRIVADVATGYPADLAGVQVGDALVSETELKGPSGTQVTATFSRDGKPYTVTMTRTRICEKTKSP